MSDLDERAVLVCVRIADMPRPGVSSIADRCARCAAAVWRSALSARLEPAPEIVCIRCMLEGIAAEIPADELPAEIVPAPYVAEDLRRRRLS